MKKAKAKEGYWRDDYGFTVSWDELVEEVMVMRLTNRNLHNLLTRYKVPVKDVANASYQAQKEFYQVQPKLEAPLASKPAEKTAAKTAKKSNKIKRLAR